MPSIETCQHCRWLRMTTGWFACMHPHACRWKYPPVVTFGTTTKPVGYRTPEDRLTEIEHRMDRLEGEHGRGHE